MLSSSHLNVTITPKINQFLNDFGTFIFDLTGDRFEDKPAWFDSRNKIQIDVSYVPKGEVRLNK